MKQREGIKHLLAICKEAGVEARYETRKRGHPHIVWEGGDHTVPGTPSDRNWLKNSEAVLRKALDFPKVVRKNPANKAKKKNPPPVKYAEPSGVELSDPMAQLAEIKKAMKISETGIYDIPEADYHADPCPEPSLSRSVGKLIVARSPLHAWCAHPRLNPHHENEQKAAFDLGSACHELVLGQESSIVVVEFGDWRKKAAKDLRDEAYAAGKTPLLVHQYDEAKAMERSLHSQLKNHEEAALFLHPDCRSEHTAIWREGEAWCRVMMDRIAAEGGYLFDYKTANSANPDDFGVMVVARNGYDVQDAFYRRGYKAVTGKHAQFRFIVQETSPPYAVSVIALDPIWQEIGDAKVRDMIYMWQQCMKHDVWPGYPDRTCYASPPFREKERWLDGESGSSARMEMTDFWRNWQAPNPKAEK